MIVFFMKTEFPRLLEKSCKVLDFFLENSRSWKSWKISLKITNFSWAQMKAQMEVILRLALLAN